MPVIVKADNKPADKVASQQQQQVADTANFEEAKADHALQHSDHNADDDDLTLKRFKQPTNVINPEYEADEEKGAQQEAVSSAPSTPKSVVHHKVLSQEHEDCEDTSAAFSSSEDSASAQSEVDYSAIHNMELNQFKGRQGRSPSLSEFLEGKNTNDVAFPDGYEAFTQNTTTTAWDIPTSKPDFTELYGKGFPLPCITDIVESFKHHAYGEGEIMRIAEHVATAFVTGFLVHERLTKALGMGDIQIYTMRLKEDSTPYPFADVCGRIIRYDNKQQSHDACDDHDSVASMQDLITQTLFAMETVRRVNRFLKVELDLKTAAEEGALAYRSLTYEAVSVRVRPEWTEWLVSAAVGLLAAGVMLYFYK